MLQPFAEIDDNAMLLKQKLEQLNIPEREAEVYVALVQLGLTTVGPIVTKTKLHRMLVYQALERLKDLKMASVLMKNGRQHWQATNPSIILDRIKKQETLAKEVVSEVELLRQASQDDLHVHILYGRRGLLDNLETAIQSAGRTDKIIRIVGGVSDNVFYELLGDWYKEYRRLQEELGVKKQLIAPENDSDNFKQRYAQEPGNEFRSLNVGLTTPTFTRITQEMVSIEVYGKEPVIIQIQNRTIAQSYLESFKLLWEQGRS